MQSARVPAAQNMRFDAMNRKTTEPPSTVSVTVLVAVCKPHALVRLRCNTPKTCNRNTISQCTGTCTLLEL